VGQEYETRNLIDDGFRPGRIGRSNGSQQAAIPLLNISARPSQTRMF
jgi:hypothetical protein